MVESAGRDWAFIELRGEADDVVGVGDFEEAFSPRDWRSCVLKSCSLVSWPLSANGLGMPTVGLDYVFIDHNSYSVVFFFLEDKKKLFLE